MIRPYQLWSLLEMLKLYSSIFSKLMVRLYDLEGAASAVLLDEDMEAAQIDAELTNALEFCLTTTFFMANEMGLDAASVLAERM